MSAAPETPLRSIITGGAGAIGRGVIRALESRGDQVLCLDRVEPEGDSDNFTTLDVTQADSVTAAMESVHQRLGGLNVLLTSIQGQVGIADRAVDGGQHPAAVSGIGNNPRFLDVYKIDVE